MERIAAGGESAYAVRNGGKEVLAWGENSKGQLGTGDTERHPTPKPVMFTPPSPVVELEGGSHHVLARLQNGQVYAWGADESGQLGFAIRGRRHPKGAASTPARSCRRSCSRWATSSSSPPAKPTASPSKKKKAARG